MADNSSPFKDNSRLPDTLEHVILSPVHIFLSPHHDDICFSLGGHIQTLPGSLLLNIFTQSTHAIGMQEVDIDDISNMRLEEDKKFSAKCQLRQYNLGLRDASILSNIPYDLRTLDQEVAKVRDVLLPLLWDLLSAQKESPPIHLYCPLGIGGHRNHLSVFEAIFQNYKQLQSRAKIYFYEELPYFCPVLGFSYQTLLEIMTPST